MAVSNRSNDDTQNENSELTNAVDATATLHMRSDLATYIVFGVMFGWTPLLLVAALEGHWDINPNDSPVASWIFTICVTLFVCLVNAWIYSFRVDVENGTLTYRSLFAKPRVIRLDQIAKARITAASANTKPYVRLEITPIKESGLQVINIGLKVFRLDDIQQLSHIVGIEGSHRCS